MSVSLTCNVTAAGPAEDGFIYIRLVDIASPPSFEGARWFRAYKPQERPMLATALACLASGFNAWADVAAVDEYSTINRLYATR